jgi:hypothetical protein
MMRHGRFKAARHPREPLPCGTCPKVPEDAPFKDKRFAVELDDRGWMAWDFYQTCKAVGRFPDDHAVEQVAKTIAAVEERARAHREGRRTVEIAAVMAQVAAAGPDNRVPLPIARR